MRFHIQIFSIYFLYVCFCAYEKIEKILEKSNYKYFSFVSFSPPVCRVVPLNLEFFTIGLRTLKKHLAL